MIQRFCRFAEQGLSILYHTRQSIALMFTGVLGLGTWEVFSCTCRLARHGLISNRITQHLRRLQAIYIPILVQMRPFDNKESPASRLRSHYYVVG